MNPADTAALISCLDLTSLNTGDNPESISVLCQQANTTAGPVASICVYPEFVSMARKLLIKTPIKITTVANFPDGRYSIEHVRRTIQQAIVDGAHEIDIVIPSQKRQLGNFIAACKSDCNNKLILKIILETGALTESEIKKYSEIALENEADFIKTSTGKIPAGASSHAAKIMLNTIKKYYQRTGRLKGFKAAGGVRSAAEAQIYLNLAQKIVGSEIFSPDYFRIGASILLQNILQEVK